MPLRAARPISRTAVRHWFGIVGLDPLVRTHYWGVMGELSAMVSQIAVRAAALGVALCLLHLPLRASAQTKSGHAPPDNASRVQNPEPPMAAEPSAPPGSTAVEEPTPGPSAGLFSQHRIRLSLLVGSGSSRSDRYLILGAGVGYFVLDGLALGFEYEAWLAGDPALHRISPDARYVFYFVPTIKPYVGGFYRHTFVTNYEDLDSLGARGGIYYAPDGARFYLGGGAAYERLLACASSAVVDCDVVYPEITLAFGF